MKTIELIDAIVADAGSRPKRLTPAFWAALGVSVFGAGLAFGWLLGPRADIAAAVETVRFPLKFIVTSAFGLAAAALVLRLARPGADRRPAHALLAAAAALLAVSVAFELWAVPSAAWAPRMVGRNSMVCLANVPILSAVPLIVLLAALRRGAPDHPALLGAAAGLLAGSIGATFYAAHCPDDSPLFVAVWYTLAVGFVTLAGAVAGSRLLKW